MPTNNANTPFVDNLGRISMQHHTGRMAHPQFGVVLHGFSGNDPLVCPSILTDGISLLQCKQRQPQDMQASLVGFRQILVRR